MLVIGNQQAGVAASDFMAGMTPFQARGSAISTHESKGTTQHLLRELPSGYLTKVPGSPFPVNHSVTAVAVHPNGNLVFATRDEQAAGDRVAVFQVQSDGSLKPAPGSPYSTQNGPQALVVILAGNISTLPPEATTSMVLP